MRKQLAVLIMLFMTITLLLSGCSEVMPKKNEGVLIGLSLDSIVVERWQRELEILVATVNELGAEIDVQIANESIDKQNEQINYLIDKEVDVLIIVPNDAKGFYDAISEAKRRGIKIIAYDRLIMHPDIDAYISFDNVGTGRGISQRLIDALKETPKVDDADEPLVHNLLIINGDPKDNNSNLLNTGFHDVIDDYVDGGFVNIVEEIWANEWREQFAIDLVEKHLSNGVRIDGIIAANDVLATGAIEVLSKWRMAGEVLVVSQDAELSACQRIVEKTQLATVYKPIYDLATTAAKVAVGMAEGEKLITNDAIYNGYLNVPYLKLDIHVVDLENMESVIINSGFHREEDIYRNISNEN